MRRLEIAGSVVFLVLSVAAAIATAAANGRGADAAFWNVVVGGASILVVAATLNAVAILWATRARHRCERLSEDALLAFESGRFGGLERFVSPHGSFDVSYYLCVTVDATNLRVWHRYSPPRPWRSVPLQYINAVSAEEFYLGGRRRYRLILNTSAETILIPVLGKGLVRMLSPKQGEVESVAARLRSLLPAEGHRTARI